MGLFEQNAVAFFVIVGAIATAGGWFGSWLREKRGRYEERLGR